MSRYNTFAALDSDDEDVPSSREINNVEQIPKAKPAIKEKEVLSNGKFTEEKRQPSNKGGKGKGKNNKSKRDFDRRSGTGRGKETSKNGSGPHNWGNEKDEAKNEASGPSGWDQPEEKTETTAWDVSETVEETPVNVEAPVEEEAEAEEEEPETMTYDEYMAKKNEERSTSDFLAPRTTRKVVNEFKNAVVISKDDKTPDFMESLYEKVHTKKTSGRKKQVFEDVGFRTSYRRGDGQRGRGGARGGRRENDGERKYERPAERREEKTEERGEARRGGRGERGGRRGGRGRGAGRGGRGGRNDVPNANDTQAFPSLS